jgi:xanthosine utilization system XapX-like protein
MNISLVLFIHVLSAIALFVAIAFEGEILVRLRTAQNTEQLRQSAGASRRLGAIYGPAFLGILVAGMYLAFRMHIRAPWVPLALVGTLLMGIVSGVVTGIHMSRLRKALAQTDLSFENLRGIARSSALAVSYGFRAGLAVGILFLMSATPGLVPSIAALTIASILGIFAGLLFPTASRSSSASKSAQSATTRS